MNEMLNVTDVPEWFFTPDAATIAVVGELDHQAADSLGKIATVLHLAADGIRSEAAARALSIASQIVVAERGTELSDTTWQALCRAALIGPGRAILAVYGTEAVYADIGRQTEMLREAIGELDIAQVAMTDDAGVPDWYTGPARYPVGLPVSRTRAHPKLPLCKGQIRFSWSAA